MSNDKKKRKNPMVALILSGILPGLGQIYNNQFLKGLILIGLNVGITILAREPVARFIEASGDLDDIPSLLMLLGYAIAGLILIVFAMIDAKKTADRINLSVGDSP
ncbi:MAG: hypothetical protein E4H21_00495 [Thermodesulfobacteriales bacterium]|nr:MAG: hypothetical protein E4H21_00495 [Thermodesulfobacteriales bacterium]